jgi:hypothetical protein
MGAIIREVWSARSWVRNLALVKRPANPHM